MFFNFRYLDLNTVSWLKAASEIIQLIVDQPFLQFSLESHQFIMTFYRAKQNWALITSSLPIEAIFKFKTAENQIFKSGLLTNLDNENYNIGYRILNNRCRELFLIQYVIYFLPFTQYMFNGSHRSLDFEISLHILPIEAIFKFKTAENQIFKSGLLTNLDNENYNIGYRILNNRCRELFLIQYVIYFLSFTQYMFDGSHRSLDFEISLLISCRDGRHIFAHLCLFSKY